MADKYNVTGMVPLCEEELSKNLKLNNAIESLEAAIRVVAAGRLKSDAIRFVADNIRSLMNTPEFKRVVDPNPDLLREILDLTLQPKVKRLKST